MKRNIYIDNITVKEALNQYLKMIDFQIAAEDIPIREALNRITAKPVFANVSSPSYHCAAMDGIAVIAEETHGASEKRPLVLNKTQYVNVNTGNALPDGCDSVIMIEDVVYLDDDAVQLIEPAHAWQHIRVVGEDIAEGEMVIPSKHQIRPVDLGALISAGITVLSVYKKIHVGIMPTGDEIVETASEIQKGHIIDSNSSVLAGLVEEMGGIAKRYSPVADQYEVLKKALLSALDENDLLMVNAGSSAGTKDYTAQIVAEIGEVMVHGVAMKPGKPTILGKINGKPVIGIPGYPVSAYFAFETFVKPILSEMMHMKTTRNKMKVILSQRIMSSLKHEEKVRVILGYVSERFVATPLHRGAGASMSLVKADAILTVPREVEGIESGSEVEVELLKDIQEVVSRISVIGSHDLILDYVQDQLPLASSHVGSMGGIMALRRKECHIAPIHLLDESTGTYNLPFVKRYFKNNEVVIIKGVKRLQGLIVKKGNPKNIQAFEDLVKADVHFINRQRGSGTRQLLDYHLKKEHIEADSIIGYAQELTTHLGVAVAVASEGIDVGLGVYSAAKTMGLDFIPVGYEAYDFLVPKAMLGEQKIMDFISFIESDLFKETVIALGGYQIDDIGTIVEGEDE